jgi:DNA-binding NtrC family response regulator
LILSSGPSLDVGLLDIPGSSAKGELDELLSSSETFQDFKDKAEAAFIKRQLEVHKWNISKTAEALDIQRSHLYTKMKKYGLAREEEDEEES